SGTLTFAPGQTNLQVYVWVNGDTVFENNETFFLNLSGAVNATLGTAQGTGTVINDDASPSFNITDYGAYEGNSGTTAFTFTVSLSAASGATASVNYGTVDGSATVAAGDYQAASGTLTFSPGQTSKTITVLVNGDAVQESNETFSVNLTGAVNASIARTQA